jgi:GTP-binding protein HflX
MYEIATKPRERAILVAVVRKGSDPEIVREHLDELALLLDTAGADAAARITQERERPEVATALGRGKVDEVKELIEESGASMVVFDDDLTPVQVRNLEKAFNVKVLDRAGVILDIFAARARSAEARTQVELAQLEYLFPRLTRMWTHLSKQFGGVGTKGPGETQIETDRRMYRTRIQRLREKLREIDTQRAVQRRSREGMPRFALVGYTNAGKSSLLRTITAADVYIENRLFATLDTTVRAFELPSGQRALLSDTVGFIRKLPAQLVASFRSTLAEAMEADVIVHVVDVTSPHVREHIDVVQRTLAELGVEHRPSMMVFNKVDALEDRLLMQDLEAEYPGCVFVSAERGINMQRLLARMQDTFEETSIVQHLLIPYEHMRDVSALYDDVEVLLRDENDDGIRLAVRLPSDKLSTFQRRYAAFITAPEPQATL